MQPQIGTWVCISELPEENNKTPEKTHGDRIYQIQLMHPKYSIIAVPVNGDWEIINFDRLTEIPSPLTPYWRFSKSGRYLEVAGDSDIIERCDRLMLSEQISLAEERVKEIEKSIARQQAIASDTNRGVFAIDNAQKAMEEMNKDRDRELALLEQLKSYPVVFPAAAEKFKQWVKTPTAKNKMREAVKDLPPNSGPPSLHPNSSPLSLHPNSSPPSLHPNSVRVQDGSLHPNSVREQDGSLHPNSSPPSLHPNSVREQDGSLHPNTTDSVRVQTSILHPNTTDSVRVQDGSLHPNPVREQDRSLHPNRVRVQDGSLHPNIDAGLGCKHLSQKQIEKVKKALRRRGYDVEEILCTDKAHAGGQTESQGKKILGWKDWKEIRGKGPYAYFRCRVPGKRSPLSIYLGK